AVIFNRVSDARFPSNVCAVVKDGGELPPCQFSWWCDGKSDRPRDRDAYAKLRTLAARWVANPPRDATGGALFFHARGMAEPWRVQRVRTAAIGSHVFYR
ncbi:MAG: cell wall hydrolase, partial [Pseudomonadota bacterium]